jgi:hypothetical protein
MVTVVPLPLEFLIEMMPHYNAFGIPFTWIW